MTIYLGELGALFNNADAHKKNNKQSTVLKDTYFHEEGGHTNGVTPDLKIACVRFGPVTCCLNISWPPSIYISCEGKF